MAILTKAQLEALNQSSFPDQSTEAITPAILRNYNTQTIDTLVDSLDTGSFIQDLTSLNAFTASQLSINSGLNASTASQQISINNLNSATASYDAKFATIGTQSGSWGGGGSVPAGTVSSSAQIVGLGFLQTSSFNTYTSSTNSSISQLNASSASQQISINALNTNSGSVNSSITQLNASSASQQISINALNAATSSYVTSAITASSLITASFSGNTLTFTKGDSSTFGVVIPDVSGSTLPSGLLSSSVTNFTDYSASVDSRINAITASGGIPAGTVSSSAQILNYGIFATTGSNTFTANQTISSSLFISGNINMVNGSDLVTHHVRAAGSNGLELQTSAGTVIVAMGQGGGTQAGFVGAVSANSISASTINGLGDPLAFSTSVDSRLDGLEAATSSYVTSNITASSLVTASFSGNTLTFTKGDSSTFGVVIPDVSGSTIDTGSFATTGSNTFIGNQTFQDGSNNASTLSPYSGSLVLVPKGTTSGSAGLSHITASTSTQVNLIFKGSNAGTGSLTISGSGNILLSPSASTAGFIRYVGNNNIFLTTALPEMTGSLTYSPTINGNMGNNILRFRGPASSSAWAMSNNILNGNFNIGNADATSANQAVAGGNMGNNILLSGVNYNAYTTPLVASANFGQNLCVGNSTLTAFSSSIQANFNIFNANTFTVNNSYFGTASTNAAQRLALSYNVFGGLNSSTLTASGSNSTTSAPREVIGNTTNGSGNLLGVVLNGDNSNLYSTLVHGSNLTVTGSSLYNNYQTAGGAFLGRNNSVNGNAARSGETIFAVGTGTSTSVRKTGFLIDSGSNTFVEGTLNVSGSTSFNGAVNITGSLTSSLTLGYVWVGGAGNVSTLVATSSFSGVTSAITASSLITASVNLNTITFTKGDSSTFAITVDTGSGGGGSVPTGTVSSSAQILGYNIFATTGSNTFNGIQTLKNALKFEQPTGGSDNFINLASVNESTLYIQNTSVSSGYQSGSVLQITENTGSNGYGFSGSAVFQMDALYNGNSGRMQVGALNGVGGYINGYADTIQFAKQGGFPNTPATSFRVDATSIELSGSVKVNTGSSGSAGIVSVGSGGTTVNNGLVTAASIILATTQELGSGDEYPAVVSGKTNGSFTLNHNFGGSLNVAYLIINPI